MTILPLVNRAYRATATRVRERGKTETDIFR